MAIRGGNIILDAGKQTLTSVITITQDNSINSGQGASTEVVRGVSTGSSAGFINIQANNTVIRDMTLDGAITSPVGLQYTVDFTSPTDSVLLSNSTMYVGGSVDVDTLLIENVTFQNTGGYAIFLDARTHNISNVVIQNCKFLNNSPNLFGTSGADKNYGSWTGGILFKNGGTTGGCVKNLTISNCQFTNCSGNAIWGHSEDFFINHQNIIVDSCTFIDMGLDCIEFGNVDGGSVTNNTLYRIGYIAGSPKFDPGGMCATGIDSTGFVRNVTYSNNSIKSINGHGMDLDGLFDSSVTNNTIQIPDSSDPYYTTDDVASYGFSGSGNISVGINPGNTFYKWGGSNLTITGNTIKGMGYWSLTLGNVKDSVISHNNIVHTNTNAVPVILFNKPNYDAGVLTDGAGTEGTIADKDFYRSRGNLITNNRIDYNQANFCIVEDQVVAGQVWLSTDINQCFGNVITGANYGEFSKDSTSGSFAGASFQTNDATSTSPDTTQIKRIGTSTTAATRISKVVAGTETVTMQLSDGGFLNVSLNGAASTGSIATGNRTTLAWADSIGSSKVSADGFIAIGATTYSGTQANLLDCTWGELRYVPDATHPTTSPGDLQYSVSVVSGARVWVSLVTGGGGGGGSVAGSNTQIQFNNAGSFGASSAFTWNDSTKVLSVAGSTGTAGIVVATSYVQSDQGFYTTSSAVTAINAPSGGVFAQTGIFTKNASIPSSVPSDTIIHVGGVDAAGTRILIDGFGSTGNYCLRSCGGTAASPTGSTVGNALGVISAFGYGTTGYSSAGRARIDFQPGENFTDTAQGTFISFNTTALTTTTLTERMRVGSQGVIYIAGFTDDGSGAIVQTTGFHSATTGYYSAGTNSDTVKIPNGGVTSKYLISVRNDGGSGVSIVRTSSTGRNYGFGVSSSGKLQLNDDTATALRMEMDTAGAFSWGGGNVSLDQSGNISFVGALHGAGSSAFVNVTGNTVYNSIETSGGMYAVNGFTADQAFYTKQLSSHPTNPGSGYGGWAYKGATGGDFWYYNTTTSAWVTVDLAAAGGGGTISGSGTTGQVTFWNGTSSISASSNFTFASQVLTVTAASSSVAGIVCATGFIQSAIGFYSPNSQPTTLNIPSGGGLIGGILQLGAGIIHDVDSGLDRTDQLQIKAPDATFVVQATNASDYMGLLMIDNNGHEAASFQYANASAGFQPGNFFIAARTSGAAIVFCSNGLNVRQTIANTGEVQINSGQLTITPTSSSINTSNGAIYYNSGTGLFQFRQAGAWVGLAGGGSGVSSLNTFTGAISIAAGTGISISGLTITNTGIVSLSAGTGVSVSGSTISIGQAVGTGNSVTFNAITSSGAVTSNFGAFVSGVTSTTIGLNINSNFTVDGNGKILSNSLLKLNGTCEASSFSTTGSPASSGIVQCAGLVVSGGVQFGGSFGISVTRAGGTFVNGLLVA